MRRTDEKRVMRPPSKYGSCQPSWSSVSSFHASMLTEKPYCTPPRSSLATTAAPDSLDSRSRPHRHTATSCSVPSAIRTLDSTQGDSGGTSGLNKLKLGWGEGHVTFDDLTTHPQGPFDQLWPSFCQRLCVSRCTCGVCSLALALEPRINPASVFVYIINQGRSFIGKNI